MKLKIINWFVVRSVGCFLLLFVHFSPSFYQLSFIFQNINNIYCNTKKVDGMGYLIDRCGSNGFITFGFFFSYCCCCCLSLYYFLSLLIPAQIRRLLAIAWLYYAVRRGSRVATIDSLFSVLLFFLSWVFSCVLSHDKEMGQPHAHTQTSRRRRRRLENYLRCRPIDTVRRTDENREESNRSLSPSV